MMVGVERERVKNLILEKFLFLGDELEVIIMTGSIASEEFNASSDIDLIVSVKNASFGIKKKTSNIISALEKTTERKIGANIVLTTDLISPIDPLNSLDGKTYQALIEIINNKNMILFDPNCFSSRFYRPSLNAIKKHSCKNIHFFKLRERKLSTHDYSDNSLTRIILDRQIRASFIVSKLAIQALRGETVINKMEIINKMKEIMLDQKEIVSVLEKNINYKQNMVESNELVLLGQNDKYIEEVANYVSKL